MRAIRRVRRDVVTVRERVTASLKRSSTIGAGGGGATNRRRKAIGGPGCCWPVAALARPAAVRSVFATRSSITAAAGSRWSRRPQPMPAMSWSKARAACWRSGHRSSGPQYEPTKRRLTWPNGAIAITYSADEPERLRGPQHDAAWCDEIASWRYPEAWDMLLFGLRLGQDPRVVVTTTPKPIKIIRELIADPTTVITRGSTYDNRANLAPAFLQQIVRKYEGTRLGRQELNAEILDDVPGALWSRALIEETRWPVHRNIPGLVRIVVAIDPAVSTGEDADETGIIVAGKDANGRGYVLADQSGRYPPTEWARTAIALYRQHKADRIVAEVNNGGDMVEATIRMVDPNVSYNKVHASRGKV